MRYLSDSVRFRRRVLWRDDQCVGVYVGVTIAGVIRGRPGSRIQVTGAHIPVIGPGEMHRLCSSGRNGIQLDIIP
jgi:hypothetical protein